MIIEYEGQRYPFDFDDITVKQAIKIEKHGGRPLPAWGEALQAGGDMLALQALGWLILNGGQGAIDDCDFKIVRLGEGFAKGLAAEAGQPAVDEAPGPTVAVPASSGHPDPEGNGAGTIESPLSIAASP